MKGQCAETMMHAKLIQSLPWDQHHTEDTMRMKGKTQAAQVFKMVYTEFVHCLWMRNMRFSERMSIHSNSTAKESV